VRGVGEKVVQLIVQEREENGPFTSLHDFVDRLPSSCYNRKTLEALIKSGAFDSTGYTRKQLMYFVDETPLLDEAAKRQRDKSAGQVSMFDMFADDPDSGFVAEVPEPNGVEWDKRTLLAYEKEILKMYVSDHPLRPYENFLANTNKYTMAALKEKDNPNEKGLKNLKCAGMIADVSTRRTKRGTLMATFTLEDLTGSIEGICFDYEKFSEVLEEDAVVTVRGKFEIGDRGNQLIAYEIERLELTEEQQNAKPLCMELQLKSNELNSIASARLLDILKTHPGNDPIVLFVTQSDGNRMRAELPMTIDSRNNSLKANLHDLFGREIWKAS
jgi:DNA polymerase-3 subunit alpha